jgi:hypothetical protein
VSEPKVIFTTKTTWDGTRHDYYDNFTHRNHNSLSPENDLEVRRWAYDPISGQVMFVNAYSHLVRPWFVDHDELQESYRSYLNRLITGE